MPIHVGSATGSGSRRGNAPKVGDIAEVQSPGKLPRAPSGTKWKLVAVIETLPEIYRYKLVSSSPPPKGKSKTVNDFFELPPLTNEVWKFVKRDGDRFTYQKAPVNSGTVVSYNEMVRAFNAAVNTGSPLDSTISPEEAQKIIAAASGNGGPDDIRIAVLHRALVQNSGRLTSESNRILNRFLIGLGIPGE